MQNCYLAPMVVIPQKELRNNVAAVLRRAEVGEEIIITVSGRPVAQLGPTRSRRWVKGSELSDLWDLPVDANLTEDLRQFDSDLQDPWSR